jgi:hypothetical protein
MPSNVSITGAIRAYGAVVAEVPIGGGLYRLFVAPHETCTQCRFDGGDYDDAALLEAIRDLGPAWRALLVASGDRLRVRPSPDVWSPIEYAAHTRDVTALHVFGVEQALTKTEPVLPAVEPGLADAAAAHYADEDPAAVASAIERETERLATVAERAEPDAWQYGITLGTDRSDVRQLLEHALHDSLHHVDDVQRQS